MNFQYIKLPYELNALEPFLCQKAMELHYEHHYKQYVNKLNSLVHGTRFEGMTLRDIILKSHLTDNVIFDNASQAWSHTFFWNSISPKKNSPSRISLESINDQFGSIHELKEKFTTEANSLFGSGWLWLVKRTNGDLGIDALENAETPFTKGDLPLLVCDLWEHAYYLDYQNQRSEYLDQFWNFINWNFFEKNLHAESPYILNRQMRLSPDMLIHEY